jgi:hypothetical protein
VLLDANIPVFSFIYGVPPREILARSSTSNRRAAWRGIS